MQFKAYVAKDGSKSWSVIRWTYDASKSRSVPETVGTVTDVQVRMNRQHSGLLVFSKLDAAEQGELAAWFAATRGPIAAEMHARWLSRGLADSSTLVEGIQAGDCTPEMAARLWGRLDSVAAALRKAGLKRPAPAKAVAVDPGPTPIEIACTAAKEAEHGSASR